MSRYDREPSTVMVKVLDMQPIAEQALEWKRKHQAVDGDEPMAGCHVGQTWGIVETPRGLYALCTEGVGPEAPVTAEHKLVLDFYEDNRPNPEGGGYLMSIVPFGTGTVDDDDLRGLPVVREEPLHEFIRSFGARLEANYSGWKRTLEQAVAA